MAVLLVLAGVCVLTWVWLFLAAAQHDRLIGAVYTGEGVMWPPLDERGWGPTAPARPPLKTPDLPRLAPIAMSPTDQACTHVPSSPHRSRAARWVEPSRTRLMPPRAKRDVCAPSPARELP